MRVLDLGCGKKKLKGALGVDISKDSDADIIANLNHIPLPFKDNSFDLIHLDNVLEHLDNLIGVVEEIWRIAKPGARVVIKAPWYMSKGAFQDPTHRHFITDKTFDYFLPNSEYNFYTKARFRIKKLKYIWGGGLKIKILRIILGDRLVRESIMNAVVGIEFELEVVK